ncbi:MAG: formylglycine-generating enzyme family protein [Planctomycetota bacterium]
MRRSKGRWQRRNLAAGAAVAALVLVAIVWGRGQAPGVLPRASIGRPPASSADSPSQPVLGQMVRLSGGLFRMGSDYSPRADERPARDVFLDPFWIDRHEVTNAQFAAFVKATGYATVAEQRGWSWRFDHATGTWARHAGADWRHPAGPDSRIDGRELHPVVHVSWYDAAAYCRWAEAELPTEAQWECAARSGLRDTDFPWGPTETLDGRIMANYRQLGGAAGEGVEGLAPVMSFPPNAFEMFDMAGNVWEWCRDGYAANAYWRNPTENPIGPEDSPTRVARGGSWLCPERYRLGITVFAREHHPPDYSSEHTGFRCSRPANQP